MNHGIDIEANNKGEMCIHIKVNDYLLELINTTHT